MNGPPKPPEGRFIKRAEVSDLILEACPSFRKTWEELDEEDRRACYVVAGEFAHHLLHLYEQGLTDEFPAVCGVFERLQLEGTPYVQELATIGFLEGIQNVWSHTGVDPEVFYEFLLPESRLWWCELNDFWEQKIPSVGATIDERRKRKQ
jgi:hypothetical protein